MKIKREYLILILILFIGLLIRIHLLRIDVFHENDVVHYSHLGKNLIESGKYSYGENFNMGVFMPPGYPIFVGLLQLFIDDLSSATKLVSLIFSVITIFLFFLIGKEIYNKEAGLFAALACAVHPLILSLSIFGLPDAQFLCLQFLSIYVFIVSIRKDHLFMYVGLGMLFALTYLTKPDGLLLMLLPFLHLFGFFGNKPNINKRQLLKIFLMISVFILSISPYLIFLKNNTGQFSVTGKVQVNLMIAEEGGGVEFHKLVGISGGPYERVAYALNEGKDQVKGFDSKVQFSLVNYVLKDPFFHLSRYIRNVLHEVKVLFKLLAPILLPLFFTFFYKDLFKIKTRLIFLLLPVLYSAIYPFFYVIERHMSVIVSHTILFSSVGFMNSDKALLNLFDFYNIRKNKIISFLGKNIKYIILAIMVISSILYIAFSEHGKRDVAIEHVNAGYFLKDTVSSEYEKLNVMALRPFVSFYSNARFTMLPYANSIDVIDFAKLYNVDYIVIDERFMNGWEAYDELIEMDKYSDKVELVYKDNTDKLIKLFRIKE
jgi:hypothetical protein